MQMSCAIPYVSLFWHQQTDNTMLTLFSCTMHCTFDCILLLFNFQNFYVSVSSFFFINRITKETLLIQRFVL